MEKIMILGANVLQLPLIKQAKKDGYVTIVVAPNKNEPGFEYADISAYIDLKDEKGILNFAKKHQINGIITDQTDIPVRTTAYVAEKLGLSGIGYETACLFTDKFQMREQCKKLGIKTLKYKKVDTLNEAIFFWKRLGGSVILKPIDNQGSKGVYKVTSEKEMIEKFPNAMEYSRKGEVLVEQFITGIEFFVEGMAVDYKFRNLICGDTHYFNIPDVFSATSRTVPSNRNKEIVEKVNRINEKIITGFGLRQGITHSEFIVSEGEVYLIETAARGGGVFISSDIISLSTGLNTEKFLINLAIGKQVNMPEIGNLNIACGYMAFFLPEGKIVALEGIEEVKELAYTHRNNLETLFLGKETKPYTDKTARYFIVVSANSLKELKQRMDFIRETINIKVDTANGFKSPIWQ